MGIAPAEAGSEKGSKKCTDGVDNDNDGLIDGEDPDCGGGDGGGGTPTGNFRVTIDWDGAVTQVDLMNATIECADNSMLCDISGDASFIFKIPESYWSQFGTMEIVEQCFPDGFDVDNNALVPGTNIFLRDHHGSPGHWDVHSSYIASARGTEDMKDHTANFQGDCMDEVTGMLITCPDLPPTNGSTNTYNNGDLTRTQVASRGRPFKGDPCTCAWEDCPPLLPTTVTVQEITP